MDLIRLARGWLAKYVIDNDTHDVIIAGDIKVPVDIVLLLNG